MVDKRHSVRCAKIRMYREVQYTVCILFTYLVMADLGEEGSGENLRLLIVEALDADIGGGASSGSFLLGWSHW